MATLDQTTLNQIVAAVLQALGNTSTASPKAPAVSQPANSLEAKDKALVNGFRRRGIPLDQIVLMDRNDRSKPHTIKPFKQWMAEGPWSAKASTAFAGCFTSRKPM